MAKRRKKAKPCHRCGKRTTNFVGRRRQAICRRCIKILKGLVEEGSMQMLRETYNLVPLDTG